jgi:threonine dehydratase
MNAATGVSVADIYAARKRLRPYLRPTPLRRSEWLSTRVDRGVFLKLESVQPTNAFKIRGALNAALRVVEHGAARQPRDVVTASAGNHGCALALACAQLGLQVAIYTPRSAPETKKAAIRAHGATLVDDRPTYDAAEQAARDHASRSGALYISPYNDVDVIAGAGTVALEILDVMADVESVIVPVGGGGLIGGIGLAMKAASPAIRVIGVEVEASTAFATSIAQGRIATIDVGDSLADGLTGNLEAGSMTFELARRVVDDWVAVSEDDLRAAMRGLAVEEHLIAEGAGAAAAAAVMARRVQTAGPTAVLLSGSNIDFARFRQATAAD